MAFTVYDWLFGAAVFVAAFVATWRWLDTRADHKRRRHDRSCRGVDRSARSRPSAAPRTNSSGGAVIR